MINQNKLAEIRRKSPFYLTAFWSLLLLVNFVPMIPQPAVIIGYLWKVELALAGLILLTLLTALRFSAESHTAVKFPVREKYWIIAPLVLFTVWSGLSIIWAESSRNALHHTLLWACYTIFYILIRQIVGRPQPLDFSLKVAGAVVSILGLLCLIEYAGSNYETALLVSSRYSKYAECIAALLPVFIALAIKNNRKSSFFFGMVTVLGWLGIVFSLSRTQFIAGSLGILVFIGLVIINRGKTAFWKKLSIYLSLLVLVTVISQVSLSSASDSKQSTLNRFSGDAPSQTSFQVRFLYWNLALEMFKRRPVIGVGADDFRSSYNSARESFAAADPDSLQVNLYETILPERAHNEYLQILAELGVVGALIFVWLLFGIAAFALLLYKKPVALASLAAMAGIAAFLVSSTASSYSFRVPANGVCFFFLLALTVHGFTRKGKSAIIPAEDHDYARLKMRPFLISCGVLICAATIVFSTVRGVSLMYLQMAAASPQVVEAEDHYRKAMDLDGQETLFKYQYGLNLYYQRRADEAVPQIRFAVNNGISTSINYFNLAAAQTISGQNSEAEKTYLEALRTYPRSIFLRTAYASFLKSDGREAEAEIEFEKARQIDLPQAVSWQMAHNEGLKKLTKAGIYDKKLLPAMSLTPVECVYSLIDFQKLHNPELVRNDF